MDLFGSPLTETLTIENKLKTALNIIPQVGASWLFLRYERHLMIKRGEQLCTTQVKGTTPDTDEGKQHPRCFAKAQRTTQEKKLLPDETFGRF